MYLTYAELFREVEKAGILLPVSYLDSEETIDEILIHYLQALNPVEAIQFSSFLNMICQTSKKDEIIKTVNRELTGARLSDRPSRKILFHRDNLLHLISLVLDFNINGTGNITGGGNLAYPQKYYKALMLINSKLSHIHADPTLSIFRDCFIRDYPYYYIPEISFTFYSRRVQRYWYIYNTILPTLDSTQRNKVESALATLEKAAGVSLKEYFSVIRMILGWYLQFPTFTQQQDNVPRLGFNFNNIHSFYINRANFEQHHAFLKIVEYLAKDIEEFRTAIVQQRRDIIPGFFRHFRTFFEYPFFKIDNSNFCIIDLRFVLEGICAGFFWQVYRVAERDIRILKDQYGMLLEHYFSFLLEKVFPSVRITGSEESQPDAVLELHDTIILFEFTTEYYRFSSLYNTSFVSFKEDLYRLLLNEGRLDGRGRGKKDVGKLLKLNRYMEKLNTTKRIVPVLVTENYLGDYDMLNQFDSLLSQGIENNELTQLKKTKPLIINLDDLETCWEILQRSTSGEQFVRAIDSWNSVNKGPYHYSFTYFLNTTHEGDRANDDFRSFFDFNNFLIEEDME